jgi:hypothetical protein
MLNPNQKQQLQRKLEQLTQNKIEISGQNIIINNRSFRIPKIDNQVLSSTTKLSR